MTYLASPRRVDAGRLPAGVTAEDLANGTLVMAAPVVTDVTEGSGVAVREAHGDAVSPSS
jgi:hypothetical protein